MLCFYWFFGMPVLVRWRWFFSMPVLVRWRLVIPKSIVLSTLWSAIAPATPDNLERSGKLTRVIALVSCYHILLLT
ncbi:hypothetical protein DFP81_1047 [Marinomonas pollencensis]|uniref:Uncharacterized protein n=1 Tax=Marinomonas pollencensis TaxID=491954 RepID=A0A3E0DRQ0_9GAMM|nr:hypothetical protein DFP81_1047 [Marinomonas pollencensis]